jgi:uncharacterized protein (TIGR02300 family)
VAKPGLGTKRLCPHCGAKFYDLDKDPIVCPKCGSEVQIITAPTRGGRPEPARAAPVAVVEPEVAETPDAEFVSLEEADAEATGSKVAVADVDEEEDTELAVEDDDDAPFLEETEDEDEDVSDIIGGDIADEEET